MSRHARHGGRSHHRTHRAHDPAGPRPDRPTGDRGQRSGTTPPVAPGLPGAGAAPIDDAVADARPWDERPLDVSDVADRAAPTAAAPAAPAALAAVTVAAPSDGAPVAVTEEPDPIRPLVPPAVGVVPGMARAETQDHPAGNGHADGQGNGCTTAQMRRFIKSRPWIPMHELRRRFAINGHEDDVTPVAVGPRTLFVGLPEREGRMLGELLRGGDVGYELSIDPDTPVVIGVFPMRPVARP